MAVAKLCGILGLDAHKRLFRSWLHPTTDSNKAAIHIAPGKLAEAVDKAEAALLEAGLHIYERSGELVRPCRLDAQRSMATASNLIQVHDPEPCAWALVLTPVTEPWLLDQLSRVARFAKPSARKGDSFVTADPPLALARGLLARKGAWRLPVIRGLIEAPTLRRDRSILQDEGHDPQSGLYFDAAGIVFPKIPEEPSREDALRALERPMRGRVSPVGSFEDWTFIREALTWLDQPDPALSRSRVQDEDPEREELGEVMAAWAEAFGDRPVTVREALDFAFEGRNGLMREAEEARPRLRLLAAFEQTGFGDKVNAKRLGHWFKRKSGKIVDAKSFEKVGTDGHKSSRYVLRGALPRSKKF